MARNKLKNYLKLGIFIFGITIVLINCQNDEMKIEKSSTNTPFSIKILNKKDISKNTTINKYLEKIVSKETKYLKNVVSNSEFNFTVNTGYSKYVESTDGSFHSYTFLIERDQDNELLENLVIALQEDGTYKTFIVAYQFPDFDTMGISYQEIDFDTDTVLDSSNQKSGNCITWSTCESWNFYCNDCENDSGNGDWQCGIYSVNQVCESTNPELVTVPGGAGGYTSNTNTDIGSQWNNTVWSSNTGGGSNGNSNSTNQNENTEEDGTITPSIATSPFILVGNNENPCVQISNLLSVTDIKDRIESLKTTATLNLNYEKGYDLNFDGTSLSIVENNGSPSEKSIKVKLNRDGNTIGFIHSHHNGDRMLPQFSIDDIKTLNGMYQWRKYKNKPLDDLSVIVVSPAGVYAIVIKDYNLFATKGNKLHTSKFNSRKRRYEDKFPKVQNLMEESDVMEAITLKNIQKYGLSLFKAKDDLSGWEELGFNNQNEVIQTPCN